MLDQLRSVPQQGRQGNQVSLGPERVSQQPITVQGLDPLAVQDIGLATRKSFDRGRTDQATLQPEIFQRLKYRVFDNMDLYAIYLCSSITFAIERGIGVRRRRSIIAMVAASSMPALNSNPTNLVGQFFILSHAKL